MAEPFTFGIPLIARDTATDWPLVEALLGLTLRSAAAQTDPAFRVVIAGHDQPAIAPLDRRVTFIAADWPVEAVRADNLDSGRKKHLIAQRTLAEGGGLLMFLDGDDWVDRRLVEAARTVIPAGALGGYIADGFIADIRGHRAIRLPDERIFDGSFQRLCGSSVVARLVPEAPDALQRDPHAVLHEHYRWPETAQEHGGAAVPLPVSGAYVVNSSVNHSEVHGPFSSWRRSLSKAVGEAGFPMDDDFLCDFGLTSHEVAQAVGCHLR
ncbi:hypothetical protein SAMN02799622_04086 [Methylobacterium sp. UNC378MF]|uniref:hypothetical protein n=1 Tax=Methylobacterium sp. UNC378MF TaxID=1502748 RepID=UPI0008816C1A|nr:hypothetical protein [Methylobacterium sp. UNC378MF]SDA27606.1 hypothetical protein SAMN02799622_04086 [Methylobacterium sp. UNC378MF]